MKTDDLEFLRLWDLYSPLLTKTQREITEQYFSYDLSVAEIAEAKGVTRQSVSDSLQKSKKQLEEYEEKLRFTKAIDELCREYSAYATTVERWISKAKKSGGAIEELAKLEKALAKVRDEFGVETARTGDGVVYGKVFRDTNKE